ncbi:MAG: hypothetical protein O3A01_00465 [bacterium]|nr:hypothetical protein [bacterium]
MASVALRLVRSGTRRVVPAVAGSIQRSFSSSINAGTQVLSTRPQVVVGLGELGGLFAREASATMVGALKRESTPNGVTVTRFNYDATAPDHAEQLLETVFTRHPDGADIIYAIGACSGDAEGNPDLAHQVNVLAPLQLMAATAGTGVRTVFFSSMAAREGLGAIVGNEPANAVRLYGSQKAELESGVRFQHRKGNRNVTALGVPGMLPDVTLFEGDVPKIGGGGSTDPMPLYIQAAMLNLFAHSNGQPIPVPTLVLPLLSDSETAFTTHRAFRVGMQCLLSKSGPFETPVVGVPGAAISLEMAQFVLQSSGVRGGVLPVVIGRPDIRNDFVALWPTSQSGDSVGKACFGSNSVFDSILSCAKGFFRVPYAANLAAFNATLARIWPEGVPK